MFLSTKKEDILSYWILDPIGATTEIYHLYFMDFTCTKNPNLDDFLPFENPCWGPSDLLSVHCMLINPESSKPPKYHLT